MEDNLTVDTVSTSNQTVPHKPNYLLLFLLLILVIVIVVLANFVWNLKVQVDLKQPTEAVKERVQAPANLSVPSATQSPVPITTREETANWKTYTSPDARYTFKYPIVGWNLGGNGLNSGLGAAGVQDKEACGRGKTVYGFRVLSMNYNTQKEYGDSLKVLGVPLDNIKQSKVLDLTATESWIPDSNLSPASHNVFVIFRGRGYELRSLFCGTKLSKIEDFPKLDPDILSTFKFL